MARILVGIPCYDKVAPQVLEDYMRFAFYLGRRYQEHEFVLGIKTKSEQFRARNAIVEGAYQLACDYLLMMDDDHIIDWGNTNYASENYEFLHKLLHHMEQDKKLGLVGALYYHRGGQCKPVLLKQQGDDYRYLTDDEIEYRLQEVDIQGGGIMLIRMTALDYIAAPWFQAESTANYGTDFQICLKLKKAGYKVACDTSIEIGHIAQESKIITSQNRHIVQADATATAKDIEISTRLLPIYQEFKADIKEYLGIDQDAKLIKMTAEYQERSERFGEFPDKAEYYQTAGKPYLARAAYLARVNESWPAYHDDFLLKTIRTGVPAIGVDFGCGAGRLSFEFARGGHLIHFIDLDGVENFEFLKWRCRKYGVLARFNDWPDNNTADYVLASDVFEHLESWDQLHKICECLKPGGVLLTNYMLVVDWDNPEHINNDKPKFLEILKQNKMMTVNSCVFQKMEATV